MNFISDNHLWWVRSKGVRRPKTGRERLTISEIKKRVPVLQLLGYYFGLKKLDPVVESFAAPHDEDWMAVNCPFHKDRKPSASVNVRTGRFRCHGPCNFGGDVIDIVCWQEGLTVEEAIDWFANRWFIQTVP